MLRGAWSVCRFHDSIQQIGFTLISTTREVLHSSQFSTLPLMSKGERSLVFGEEYLEIRFVCFERDLMFACVFAPKWFP